MRLLIAALLVLAGSRVEAHDFWLAATKPAAPPSPAVVTVTGHVGETFPLSDSPTTPDRVDLWRVIGPDGEVLDSRAFYQEGQSLATQVTVRSSGAYVGVMGILAREIDMTGKEFTDYLRDEGLDRVIEERARLGQTDAPA